MTRTNGAAPRRVTLVALAAGLVAIIGGPTATAQENGRDEAAVAKLLAGVGIPAVGTTRGQVDAVGFVTTAAQMDSVLARCRRTAPALERSAAPGGAVVAAVCPHDDYAYAARLYDELLGRVTAKTVIVFGVFHKARVFGCRDRLVFDDFRAWRGPYGPVRVSALRGEILEALPAGERVVDREMHTVEHSIEAIVPFLQAYNRDVEIVPILVPYMDFETMDRLAASLAGAVAGVMRRHGLVLGRDACLISSADAVHYGDVGWGGRSYADFGTDVEGYRRAVERDRALAQRLLCGPIDRARLEAFLYTCVDRDDVTNYRLTWCGRFSVPFGLDVVSRLAPALGRTVPSGRLVGYGTSVGEAGLDLAGLGALGTTAPNNLHHWVGYAALSYR